MKSKFLTWVSALGAVALVSGILVVSANAHIGATHSPYDTAGPDLRTATVTGDDTVSYCFDEPVADDDANNDVTQYELRGFDSEQILEGDDTDLGSDDECVDVTFNPAGDQEVSAYTVAAVEAEEVETRGGDAAPAGAVALAGSTAPGEGTGSSSSAPNLRDWSASGGADSITYTFDEVLDCAELEDGTGAVDDEDAENFGFYSEDEDTGGSAEAAGDFNPEVGLGDDVLDCDENEIEILFEADDDEDVLFDQAFDDGTVEDVEDAEKAWVSMDFGGSGDVCDPDGQNSGSGDDACLDGESESTEEDIDDAPDLTDVERSDDTQFTYTFDETLDEDAADVDDTDFYIALDDGQEFFADADDCDADGSEVECDFDDDVTSGPGNLDEAEDDEIAYGGAGDCAVITDVDNAGDEVCSTIGDAPISTTTEDEGFTDGPDLEGCDIDVTGEFVDFFFDEDIDNENNEPQGDDFYVFDDEADETDGDAGDADDVEGNTVSVEFDGEDLTDSIGCGVVEDAAEDEHGNFNIEATVGTDEASSAAPTTGNTGSTTTTTVVSSQPTTTRTRKTIRVNTTATIRYDAKPKAKAAFKGSISARFEKCTTGRLVTLKKKGQGAQGTDSSNRKGNWKIRKRNANGSYHAEVAKKVYTRRNGDTIICRKDQTVSINV